MGQALWYADAGSSLIMKARAIRDGVCFVLDRNYQRVEIESNAHEVLNLMKESSGGRSKIASICQEIQELSGFFSSLKYLYVGRLANEAAHNYAKKGCSLRKCVWINFVPPFLVDILAKDCNPTI
jgi:hypothetical protein